MLVHLGILCVVTGRDFLNKQSSCITTQRYDFPDLDSMDEVSPRQATINFTTLHTQSLECLCAIAVTFVMTLSVLVAKGLRMSDLLSCFG